MSMPQTQYDAMRAAIAQCACLGEAKTIADKARALQIDAQQRKDPEMEAWVAEIRIRARRRIGELSLALPVCDQSLNDRHPSDDTPSGKQLVLWAAGISMCEAHICEQLARLPAETFERHVSDYAGGVRADTVQVAVGNLLHAWCDDEA
jgi:hypothetical protein